MLEAGAEYLRLRRRLTAATLAAAALAWRQVAPENIDATWQSPSRRLLATLILLQVRAATAAVTYIDDALREQGTPVRPIAEVATRSLAGVASDGRSLADLINQTPVRTKTLIARGYDLTDAMAAGGRNLQMLSVTQVQDVGRTASGLAIASRPDVHWIRRVRGGACDRCQAQAGKTFRWNAGFARHPRCDCYHEPVRREPTTARVALGDGMQVAGRSSRDGRAMPEQIFAEANGNRDQVVEALARLGFLT